MNLRYFENCCRFTGRFRTETKEKEKRAGVLGLARSGPVAMRARGRTSRLKCRDVAGHAGVRAPHWPHACEEVSSSTRRRTPAETLASSGSSCAHLRSQKTSGGGTLDAAEGGLPSGGPGGQNRDGLSGGRRRRKRRRRGWRAHLGLAESGWGGRVRCGGDCSSEQTWLRPKQ
jgi:hypothetical protein